ncbi:hypothetical protein Pta02_35490 [Planobispora takensis]|uniref:Lipoprotein n=1 Tax=Planobispora takensis TaxID=1367882 RepID=A0A8J3WTH9_9ACTN|nr:hypothetical protein Pta02_35490 [Planobispora takensis]
MDVGLRMRKRTVFGLALAVVTALSACSAGAGAEAGGPTGHVRTGPKGSLDVSVLRTSHYDFPAYRTPEELAEDRPVVAAGVIDGWQQGPTLDSGTGVLDYRVVLRMRVTEPLKGVKGRSSIARGLVFIELSQGAVLSDPTLPADQWKPDKSVADFEKALPAGTGVLAFPRERPAREQPVVDLGAPLPAGARLMSVPPQGLIFEDPQLARERPGGSTALLGGLEELGAGGAGWLGYETIRELVSHLRGRGFGE